MITYQDEYQVVRATSIYTQETQYIVNRVKRPDDGYAQDNSYFYKSASKLKDVLWLVDCFLSGFSELENYNPEEEDNFIPDADRFDYLVDEEELMVEDNDFDIWLSQNYIPAGEASDGEEWYLSVSPNEFMPIPLSEIKQKWRLENHIQELLEFHRDYYLTVTENQTGAIIYTRQLTDDDSLDIDSYLPEIERATEINLEPQGITAGHGGYCNITIGFSSESENASIWESKDFFLAD